MQLLYILNKKRFLKKNIELIIFLILKLYAQLSNLYNKVMMTKTVPILDTFSARVCVCVNNHNPIQFGTE